LVDKRYLATVTALLIMVYLIAGLLWCKDYLLYTKMSGFNIGKVEFEIQKGTSLNRIAKALKEARLIPSASRFRWAAWYKRAERKIQPGIFTLPYGATNSEIIHILLRPANITKNITIPEGLTARQIAGLLHYELAIDSTEFILLCENSIFAVSLGVKAERLEGYLYPDTYNFFKNSDSEQVIRRMVEQFFAVFDNRIEELTKRIGFTMHEAVTLASIIQGEVMVWDEARLVSAVYYNRLKRRMLLGADPTIQYIIPDGPRRLLNGDLKIDSPYNTYRYRGLPPGPINNPGRKALAAAVQPANVDYIYFVAKGDGSHYFNNTHAGHERDKKKLQKIRREVAKKKSG